MSPDLLLLGVGLGVTGVSANWRFGGSITLLGFLTAGLWGAGVALIAIDIATT